MTQFDHFYSDPHFGHANIIKFCDRPFRDSGHQTAELIARYNAAVRPGELVLWLGDCFFTRPDVAAAIFDRLNGRKCLIRGNHDRKATLALPWEFVLDELVFDLDGFRVRASHYPVYVPDALHPDRFADRRPHPQPGEVLIHGHTHDSSRGAVGGRTVHVGVDAWDYAPVSRDMLLAAVEAAAQ